jgi:hypothetical protein
MFRLQSVAILSELQYAKTYKELLSDTSITNGKNTNTETPPPLNSNVQHNF